MIRGNFTAYGLKIGGDGMPIPYQSYMIWATELTGLPDLAVASIITLSEGRQMNRQAKGRSERDAFDRAIAMIKALPEHHGLQFTLNEG